MIKAEFEPGNQGIEILFDSEGVDELINYLISIRDQKDSMHLLVGNELNDDPSEMGYSNVKHIKIIYTD